MTCLKSDSVFYTLWELYVVSWVLCFYSSLFVCQGLCCLHFSQRMLTIDLSFPPWSLHSSRVPHYLFPLVFFSKNRGFPQISDLWLSSNTEWCSKRIIEALCSWTLHFRMNYQKVKENSKECSGHLPELENFFFVEASSFFHYQLACSCVCMCLCVVVIWVFMCRCACVKCTWM